MASAAVIATLGIAALPGATSSAQATPNSGAQAAKSGPKKVTIPKRYVYHPHRGPQKTLHDYCTKSPDSYLKADFRGPCARHDLCYQNHGKNRVTKSVCDARLYKNLRKNCAYAYPGWTGAPTRYTCYGVASTYYDVVSADTLFRG